MAATELCAATLVGAHGLKAPQSWDDVDAMCFRQREHVQKVLQEGLACLLILGGKARSSSQHTSTGFEVEVIETLAGRKLATCFGYGTATAT